MANERRHQREAQRQLRELQRQSKEEARLSEIERARLEVQTFENRIELLRSVHKEQGEVWDWSAVAASLPPPAPQQKSYHQQRANQLLLILPVDKREAAQVTIEQARAQDEADFRDANQSYTEQVAQWEKLKSLALRILAGEHKAYTEALVTFNPFAEIAELGSSINFTIQSPKLVECVLKVNGSQCIPTEVKTLTAKEKVSTKSMPKGLFHGIYLDYLCGCALRVAREVFALLPVDTVLLTASADSLDSRTGQTVEHPVLSVALTRSPFALLNFDKLDPSEAIENFQFRGDFKSSRKAEAFQPIVPLTLSDMPQMCPEEMNSQDLLAMARRTRDELKTRIANLKPVSSEAIPQTTVSL